MKTLSNLFTALINAHFAELQGFVALMAIYTAFAFTCTAWSWFIGPTAKARQPSRMLVSHPLLHHAAIYAQDTMIVSQNARCHVLQQRRS